MQKTILFTGLSLVFCPMFWLSASAAPSLRIQCYQDRDLTMKDGNPLIVSQEIVNQFKTFKDLYFAVGDTLYFDTIPLTIPYPRRSFKRLINFIAANKDCTAHEPVRQPELITNNNTLPNDSLLALLEIINGFHLEPTLTKKCLSALSSLFKKRYSKLQTDTAFYDALHILSDINFSLNLPPAYPLPHSPLTLRPHEVPYYDAVSSDEKWAARITHDQGRNRTLEIFNLSEFTDPVYRIAYQNQINALMFSPNGNLLAIIFSGGGTIVIDLTTERFLEKNIPGQRHAAAFAFSPDSKLLALISFHTLWHPDAIQVVDVTQPICRELLRFKYTEIPQKVVFDTDNTIVAFISQTNNDLTFIDLTLPDQPEIHPLTPDEKAFDVFFSKNNTFLIATLYPGTIKTFSMAERNWQKINESKWEKNINSAALSPNSRLFAIISNEDTVTISSPLQPDYIYYRFEQEDLICVRRPVFSLDSKRITTFVRDYDLLRNLSYQTQIPEPLTAEQSYLFTMLKKKRVKPNQLTERLKHVFASIPEEYKEDLQRASRLSLEFLGN